MTTTAITLKGDPQIFKVGATVTAYLRSNWSTADLPPSGAPKGSSAASATVGSDGTIALTGLTAGGRYYAVVDLDPGGSHDYHYMQFTVGDSSDLDPGLPVTTDVLHTYAQPLDADLTALAALNSAANKVPYATGAGAWALADFTSAGRALVGDADAAAQRTTLGLGTAATHATGDYDAAGAAAAAQTAAVAAAGGTYKTLMHASGPFSTSAASGNKYFLIANNANNSTAQPGQTSSGFPILNLVASRLAIAGLTTKLYLEAIISTTAGPAVTITTGLYPLTISGGGAFVLGTVVPNSQAATTATPAADTPIPVNSGDFDLPADGVYAFGLIVSGTPANNFQAYGVLRYRNV